MRVGIFGYALQLAWNLGAYLPYLLLGDDDETKEEFWNDIWTHTMFGSIEGLTGGDVMSAAGNMWVSGEGNPQYLAKDMPLASDVMSILKKMDNDKMAAMNDVINLLVQSGAGVNPQSLTDAVVAVMDYCNGDARTSRECALLIARILNCPQSQLDKMYFDELDMSGREAGNLPPAQIAERYADYKMMREAPLTGWMRNEEEADSVRTSKEKRVLKEAKARLSKRRETEETRRLLTDYDRISDKKKEIEELRETDPDAFMATWEKFRDTENIPRYMRIGRYKRDMNDLTEKYLKAKGREELDSITSLMFKARENMLEDIEAMQQ